jgi:cytochrome b561
MASSTLLHGSIGIGDGNMRRIASGPIRSTLMLRNTEHSWGAPAKWLHWTIAALVFAQIAFGWAAKSWHLSPTKLDLFVWHKSIGMLTLLLVVARLAWRFVNVAPSLPAQTPLLEQRAAHLNHFLLYLTSLLMPLTGWIVNSAANIPFRIFWLIPLPAIIGPDDALAGTAARAHFVLFVALSLLLVVHIGAALRHHFLKHDDVLRRMLPGRRNSI